MNPSKYAVPRNNGDDSLAWRIAVVATITAVVVLIALLMPGCSAFENNPRAQLQAAQEVFVATVDTLVLLIRDGHFSDSDIVKVQKLVHRGRDYLTQWKESVLAGNGNPAAVRAFEQILAELKEYSSKAKER